MNTTREDALEQVGIYLSWVPPRHAKAAREALARVAAELERLERERDAIGVALGEPCAECGHIDWRSDGYADSIMSRLFAADEAVEAARHGLAMRTAQLHQNRLQMAALQRDRDSWEKVAREYEAALADRGAL